MFLGFPGGSAAKGSACNAGDLGSVPGLERSPGEGKDYLLQYSGLENFMNCIVKVLQRVRHNQATFTLENYAFLCRYRISLTDKKLFMKIFMKHNQCYDCWHRVDMHEGLVNLNTKVYNTPIHFCFTTGHGCGRC